MNVTFMIGNGFDLNLGLKTSYRDFYNWYLSDEQTDNDTEVVSKMKKDILKDYENWSDFELGFGKYSKKMTYNEDYRECLSDILDKLTDYLNIQNKIFSSLNYDDYDIEDMLCNFSKGVSIDVLSPLDEILVDKINVIDFNYTDTITSLINSSMKLITQFDFLNIHGTLNNNDIIFGLSEESQISNSTLFKDEKSLLVDFIKPDNIKYNDFIRLEKAENMIFEADVIYVYGMSLGETDKYWFNNIVKSLVENTEQNLIIDLYSPQPKYSRLKGERKKLVDSCRDKLLSYLRLILSEKLSHVSEGEYYTNFRMMFDNVDSRINIVVNQNIFEPLKDMCTKEKIMN